MFSKYPTQIKHSTSSKLHSMKDDAERYSNPSSNSYPSVFHYPTAVVFKDVNTSSYQSLSHNAQSTPKQYAGPNSSRPSRQSAISGNQDSSLSQRLPIPSSIHKPGAATQPPALPTAAVIPSISKSDYISQDFQERCRTNSDFPSSSANVEQPERSVVLTPTTDSLLLDTDMVSLDGIVMIDTDHAYQYNCDLLPPACDREDQLLVSENALLPKIDSNPRSSTNQPKLTNATLATHQSGVTLNSSANLATLPDVPTPPMMLSNFSNIPQDPTTETLSISTQLSLKRKSVMESQATTSCHKILRTECVQRGNSDKKLCIGLAGLSNDQRRNSIANQVTLCFHGDLKAVMSGIKASIRKSYINEFRTSSVTTVKADYDAAIIQLAQDNPFKGHPTKAALFIKNCLASIVAAVRYAFIYDMHHGQPESVSSSLSGAIDKSSYTPMTVTASSSSCIPSSVPMIYGKCLNHLRNISTDFNKAFRILVNGDRHVNPKDIDAMRRMGILAMIAAKACLSSKIYHSWLLHGQNRSISSSKAINTSKQLAEAFSFGWSDGLCQPLIPDNPASNASHDTQQETPASTLSLRSNSGNGSSIKSQNVTCFADILEGLPTLRVLEHLVNSEQLWEYFKSTYQHDTNPSSSCFEQMKLLESHLSKEFPWSLEDIDTFCEESTVVLCLIECIQRVLCGCLATV